MKICRFNDNRIGVVRGGAVHDVTAVRERLPVAKYPQTFGDALITALASVRADMESMADLALPIPFADVKFLSPVANPSKIGTPANHEAHVAETPADPEIAVYSGGRQRSIEQQGLFLKTSSSLVGPDEGVAIRFPQRRTDHEIELGVTIEKRVDAIPESKALDAVAGYSIALDMVMRGEEDRSYRKSIETHAVLEPWLVTADEISDPGNLDFTLCANGDTRQKANTRDMIVGIAKQITCASSLYTLCPGDILMSATCEGVGPVRPSDTMHLSFQGIGEINVQVR